MKRFCSTAFLHLILLAVMCSAEVPDSIRPELLSVESMLENFQACRFHEGSLDLSRLTPMTKEEVQTFASNISEKRRESEKVFGDFKGFKKINVDLRYGYLARIKYIEIYERNGYIWNFTFMYNGSNWHLTAFEWVPISSEWNQGRGSE